MIKKHLVENLGFTGGSVKGTAYVGVAKALHDTGIIDYVERVSGVSAGSIFATLIALKFSPEEMRNILIEVDYNKFADGSLGGFGNIVRLIGNHGMHSGKYFYDWMHKLIEQKTGNGDITFAQSHERNSYLDLYIVSANLNTQLLDVFSHEHTPDVKIVDAIRCSMSIPLFFEPYIVNGYAYTDGGIIDNYPIELFDNIHFSKIPNITDDEKILYNYSTLGFALTDPNTIDAYINDVPTKVMNTDTEVDIFKAIMNLILNGAQLNELKQEHARTVYINNLGVGMFDFDLSRDDKNSLIKEGYNSTIDYINKHNIVSNPIIVDQKNLNNWTNHGNYIACFDRLIESLGHDVELFDI